MTGPSDVAEDRDFVRMCVQAYYARAPRSLRLAVPRPGGVPGRPHDIQPPWPLTVPPEMWEGPPGADGWVVWKPVFRDPERFKPFSSYGGPDAPLLRTFLTHTRLCNPLIRTRRVSFYLPNCPDHDPTAGIQLMRPRGFLLRNLSRGYFPFAVTESGEAYLCLELDNPTPDRDYPVVALSAEALLASEWGGTPAGARFLFPTFRSLLSECLLNCDYPWGGDERTYEDRAGLAATNEPFDWRPYLRVAPQEDARGLTAVGRSAPPTREHVERIARKIELLRRADPGCLIPGSEVHRYRMRPAISAEALASFEAAEACELPDVYQHVLLGLGDGGFGPGTGLLPVEESRIDRIQATVKSTDLADDRLRKRFPHRQAWGLPRPEFNESRVASAYYSLRRINGTVVLEGSSGHGWKARSPVLLVVNGPERGHIWWDGRRAGRGGIHPVFRGGPFSLLAWLEGGVDHLLAQVDDLYTRLPGLTLWECVGLANQAFKLDRVLG